MNWEILLKMSAWANLLCWRFHKCEYVILSFACTVRYQLWGGGAYSTGHKYCIVASKEYEKILEYTRKQVAYTESYKVHEKTCTCWTPGVTSWSLPTARSGPVPEGFLVSFYEDDMLPFAFPSQIILYSLYPSIEEIKGIVQRKLTGVETRLK